MQAAESVDEVRRENRRLLRASTWLAVVVLAAGLATGNGHTTAFYWLLAIFVGVPGLIGERRLRRAEELKSVGTVGVQHSWITGSFAFAFLALLPSTFFSAPGWVKWVVGLIAVLWLIAGLYGLWLNTSRARVPLSI